MKTKHLLINVVLLAALTLAGCNPKLRVGELQTESQTVELGDAESVRVEIDFGAGDLEVTGGAGELLEADFTYNVAEFNPEVEYKNDTLVVHSPEIEGLQVPRGASEFRNEWDLRFNDEVPLDLSVDMGAGISDLQLSGLTLTGLDINLGASESTIDLTGDWAQDLDATIEAGVGDITVRLPSGVGVRVEVQSGVGTIKASDLTKDGDVYTNAAYGESDVTLRIDVEAGVGLISLEVEE